MENVSSIFSRFFRNSIIKSTKVDLNWFFDQWLETTKGLDYSVSNVEKN